MEHVRALTKGEVTEAVSYLPQKHKNLVLERIRTYNIRKKNHKGQIIEGSYHFRQDAISIYAFSSEEILSKRYLNTLWHEVGHKIFNEVLVTIEKERWEKIRNNEKFLIDLSDLYTFKEIWEEEFCFTYQMLVCLNFYEENKMKKKAAPLQKTLDSISQRAAFVKKTFSKSVQSISKKTSDKTCLKIAQDRLEKIIGVLV